MANKNEPADGGAVKGRDLWGKDRLAWEDYRVERRKQLPKCLDMGDFSTAGLCHVAKAAELEWQEKPPLPLEPPVFRECFSALVTNLGLIRDAWREGDKAMMDMFRDGWQPETGGFEQTVRHGLRRRVQRLLYELPLWLNSLVLPYLDPWLRDRLQGFVAKLDLGGQFPDAYGKVGDRWRQAWLGMGLNQEFTDLVSALRARGDMPVSGPSPQTIKPSWGMLTKSQKIALVMDVAREEGVSVPYQVAKAVSGYVDGGVPRNTVISFIRRHRVAKGVELFDWISDQKLRE